MSLQVRIEPAVAARITVRPVGKLDATSSQEFDSALNLVLAQVPHGGTLVFDLADLEYISSAGLRSLFRARKAMKANGGNSLIMQAQPQVRAVLDIVKACRCARCSAMSRNLTPISLKFSARSSRAISIRDPCLLGTRSAPPSCNRRFDP
jgi:anti-anti-sigma factor